MSFEHLVARQAGVVALHQAVALGMSAATVQRRARESSWRRLHPGVYLVGGHRLSGEARIRAAWLWAGRRAVVTGPAAAFWHGMLPRAPAVVDLTVPAATKPRPQPGVRLLRRDLDPMDRMFCREIEVAAEPLAVLETAVSNGSGFLDRALQQRKVRYPSLQRCHSRNLGRPGWAEAGRLLVAAGDGAESAAERLLVRILRDAGIGGWVLGHPFGPYRIDLAFPVQRVAIEVDGWAWHSDVERFRADRRKGNAITRGRWDLLRFTWHDLDGNPAGCRHDIEALITKAGT